MKHHKHKLIFLEQTKGNLTMNCTYMHCISDEQRTSLSPTHTHSYMMTHCQRQGFMTNAVRIAWHKASRDWQLFSRWKKHFFFFSDGTTVARIVENAPGFSWENYQSVFKREIILYYIFSPLQSRTTTTETKRQWWWGGFFRLWMIPLPLCMGWWYIDLRG